MSPKVVELTRDWRVRTIVPVVVVNLLAFGGLYALMYHYAMSNLVRSHDDAAALLFDDLRLDYEDRTLEHRVATMGARMQRMADAHRLCSLTLYAINGDRIIDVAGAAANAPPQQRLVYERPLDNTAQCQGCHDAGVARLGVMQMSFDVGASAAAARQRVRGRFALAGAAWLALLGLFFWTLRVVIGRPLARMEKSLQPDNPHDLDGLARAQREREETIARQMVRAEQLASLGEVAAGLTHEIKNPLAGVIAALELLRSEAADAPAGELPDQMMAQMLAELRRVTGTLDSLLRLARPRPPQRAEADLGRIVREVASLFAARARRQGVALEVELDDVLPALLLDSGLIVQLLVNLLTNSLQATERGGTVTLSLSMNGGVILAVRDTGRGIAREDLDRIFVPFFTTKEEGTGLGLAICRQIVEQHGGDITVQSEVGKGTTVIVTLPREESGHGALAVG